MAHHDTHHKKAVKEAMKAFRLGCSPNERQVEDAIERYHAKAFNRQDNAPVDGGRATLQRYVGPWEEL